MYVSNCRAVVRRPLFLLYSSFTPSPSIIVFFPGCSVVIGWTTHLSPDVERRKGRRKRALCCSIGLDFNRVTSTQKTHHQPTFLGICCVWFPVSYFFAHNLPLAHTMILWGRVSRMLVSGAFASWILPVALSQETLDYGYIPSVVQTILTSNMSSQPQRPRFRKIQSFQADYAPTSITQYESERSGMQVIVADRKGPKINGYFTLATEIFDDSGAPHTLEHLVFMGSKNYKYKGLLDKLAGRAYSNTNAWTAVDHTAYTLETAGWDGFAQILPVYLEHVILPNITDDACVTEVHHIDGEGNDAGVVYSEMQALQYSSNELMDIRARRLLYPENIGFRYETGGMMEALRVLTPDRIREFHKAMYQPQNLAIVITGEADHDDLLRILDEFEESIKDDIPPPNPNFKRPFVDSPQPPPLEKTTVETVEFPEEDESTGEVIVAFFGPSCIDQVLGTAMNIIMTYLCGSSVSVIENTMVEKEQLASSVSYWWDSRPNSVIWFQPTGVATDKLAFVEQRLITILKEVASKPLDMAYIKEVLQREKRQVQLQAEGSEQFYATNIITDYLFGKRDGSTLKDLESLEEYDILDKWTDEQWRDFLKKYISDAHHVSILGKPSHELAKKLKANEEARIAKRKEELGEEGLEALKAKLESAKQTNEKPIPPEVLDQWAVPGTESIHFIESLTARSGKARSLGVQKNEAQKIIDEAAKGLPLFVQFEDVPTNFVHLTVHIGMSKTPVKYKPLLGLFAENFFNSPVMRDGKRLEFEEVVKHLERETISYHISSASRLGDYEGVAIQLQFEPAKYETIISWLRTLMFDIVFDPVRIKAATVKALADIPELKRDGRSMAQEADLAIHFKPEAYLYAKRTLVKAVYLRRLKKLIEKEPETVVGWFEELRKSLFTFENLRVLVTANVAQLENPVAAWDALTSVPDIDSSKEVSPIIKLSEMLNEEGKAPGSFGSVVIPMTTLDSSYSVSTATGIQSYADPRLPAYLVALGYLEAVEGPLWNAVRGNGLAYGVHFSREIDGGYIQFKVYRSPDASKAIEASRAIVSKLASGEESFDRHLIEGAVSSIVSGVADEQSTMSTAAQQNYVISVVRGLEAGWNRKILERVRNVTQDQIRAVLKEVILPVFEPGRSNVVVTCAPIMEEVSFPPFSSVEKLMLIGCVCRISSRLSQRGVTRPKCSNCRTFTMITGSRLPRARKRMTRKRKMKTTRMWRWVVVRRNLTPRRRIKAVSSGCVWGVLEGEEESAFTDESVGREHE
ncbi:Metalloenzyme, LuxS/M16 peptidase-like protein [Podospora australis]|uniref:Metalloenzyme, LuxS/M16 peptidase-like protein n=1 Tax=Podospora australis TaxID=1536484 RepID=A0AAN6X593_9PEZI|nr:Metalloenzyme, LuxS/M16 peptidase-like protein [Podospora australis]